MFNAFRRPVISLIALVACALAADCSKSTAHVDGEVQQSATAMRAGSEAGCAGGGLRPSALPPEQGMWRDSDAPDGVRVVAMIGPAEVRAGSTAVTRTIETIETIAGAEKAQPIRARADAAVMHLELLPRYRLDRTASATTQRADRAAEPAAAYTLTAQITVASYDQCAGQGSFAVRYLRRDGDGRVAYDAMLHRIPNAR